MNHEIIRTMLTGWLMVFVPLGLLGAGLWALWRLIPRLRRSMGYGADLGRSDRITRHPCSK